MCIRRDWTSAERLDVRPEERLQGRVVEMCNPEVNYISQGNQGECLWDERAEL
jgi:hypothetical protein